MFCLVKLSYNLSYSWFIRFDCGKLNYTWIVCWLKLKRLINQVLKWLIHIKWH